MPLWIDWVTIDCRDARSLAEFWRAALDYEVEYSSWEDPEADQNGDGEVLLSPRDHRNARLLLLEVPDEKSIKNRLHLDLRSRDQAAEVARLEALGASRVDIGQGDVSWVVMADPEGNEFCILRDPTPDEADSLFYGAS
jgi:hypothetical protein